MIHPVNTHPLSSLSVPLPEITDKPAEAILAAKKESPEVVALKKLQLPESYSALVLKDALILHLLQMMQDLDLTAEMKTFFQQLISKIEEAQYAEQQHYFIPIL